MRRWPSSRWILAVYCTLVLLATGLAAVRLIHSPEMPGLGALELVMLGLPWSLVLGVEPMARLGWIGMTVIVLGGVLINGLLLRGLTAWLERRWGRRRAGMNSPGHG
jgi:hypothetical protein